MSPAVQSNTQPETDAFGVTLRVGDGLAYQEVAVVAAVASGRS
ncbi:hypothetical protein ABT404_19985 [Streptomyces hyaluromycini]|uniref:Uncharacterized protein n=1 Tax=Streptomyces hyaluromycini TaxID=1377993 RepID=A0ABV1WY77_9ACTN